MAPSSSTTESMTQRRSRFELESNQINDDEASTSSTSSCSGKSMYSMQNQMPSCSNTFDANVNMNMNMDPNQMVHSMESNGSGKRLKYEHQEEIDTDDTDTDDTCSNDAFMFKFNQTGPRINQNTEMKNLTGK